jgi:peptide/nickel transport system substrate-binding protein
VKRAKVTVVVALAVALAAAACSSPSKNNNSSGGGGNSGITQQQQTEDTTAVGPAPAVPGAKSGGTITVTSQSTPSAFDPTSIYYTDTAEIGRLLYRTPTEYAIRNGKPVLVPDLTDLGKVSADGLTWTFKMKQGIKYQDGSTVQVADLKYAIERSFATDVHQFGATYQIAYFKDGTTYKGPYKGGDYDGVETQGTDTLIIHLAKKFPDLPFYMTFPLFTPIPQAKDTDPTNYYKHPMTTGPYQQVSYQPGVEMKLSKNPYWDPKTDPVRTQYPDGWDFKWGGNDVKSQTAILNGATPLDQTSVNYGPIDATLTPEVVQGGPKANQLVTGDSPCTLVMNLNSQKIPLPVRKAIATAYPNDAIFKAAGLTPLTAETASTILPPSVPGYNKYPALPGLSGVGDGDQSAAKTMLQAWEKANNKTGFTLSWYYDNTQPIPQQVSAVRTTYLQKAGFTVHAIGVTTAQLRDKTGDISAPVNMGQAPAGWCSDWPTGGSWFPVLFETHSIKDGLSWGNQADPKLDAQIDAVGDLPQAQQAAAWGKLDQQLMGEYLVIPRYYDKMAIVIGTQIGGTIGDGTEGMPFFNEMYVK